MTSPVAGTTIFGVTCAVSPTGDAGNFLRLVLSITVVAIVLPPSLASISPDLGQPIANRGKSRAKLPGFLCVADPFEDENVLLRFGWPFCRYARQCLRRSQPRGRGPRPVPKVISSVPQQSVCSRESESISSWIGALHACAEAPSLLGCTRGLSVSTLC